MLKRPLIFSLFFVLLGCAHPPQQSAIVATKMKASSLIKATQTRRVQAFNHVIVEGRVDVNLHTGYSQPAVILHGETSDLAAVITLVKNDTLLVSLSADRPKVGRVTIDINSHILNSFTYRGAGNIKGPKINSKQLDLNITNPGRTILGGYINLHKLVVNGPGYTEISGVSAYDLQLSLTGKAHVQLVGVANLSNIALNGDGWLGVYWVKSDVLKVRAKGTTSVQLAGIANKLDLELWSNAHFNGRYLRAKQTFVKTHGRSVAEITTLDRQHTLATDASDIYFYEIPELKADLMAYNGAVLDLRDWNSPYLKEYDAYNK